LKNAVTLNYLHPDLKARVMKQAAKNFAASDAVMARCVSTSISLLWTEAQIQEKGEKMAAAIKKALAQQRVGV
jgi:8-amino-3,8-dideoxy-alpha-D-manno-octulosonate transaminase